VVRIPIHSSAQIFGGCAGRAGGAAVTNEQLKEDVHFSGKISALERAGWIFL
jgi:hypothetical protein